MNTMIQYEDEEILVIHKLSGIATETAKIGQADVVSELKNYRNKKNEDSYIGVIHRLDQPVEGLLVFAKTPASAQKLTRDLQKGLLKKTYYALTVGVPSSVEGRLEDYLLKDTKTNLSKVVNKATPGAKFAALSYKVIKSTYFSETSVSLLEIQIDTGRHHQIRTQMSHAGMPLVGDYKYGNEQTKKIAEALHLRQTALFAGKLELIHPITNANLVFELPLPSAWKI